MPRPLLRTALSLCLLVAGCGSDASSSGTPGAGGAAGGAGAGGSAGGGGAGLGCDPAVHCGGAGFVCGVHAVSSCGEVDCGACRFRSENIADGDIVAAPDRSIHLAYFAEGKLTYASPTDATFAPQTVSKETGGQDPSIAVAPDGTIHIVWVASGIQHAEKKPGSSAWEIRTVTEGDFARVATDGAGTPHIVVRTKAIGQADLKHAVWTGTEYTITPVGGPPPVASPALGRGPDGTIVLAYRSTSIEALRRVEVFTLTEGAFQRDPGVPELPDQMAEVSVAFTTGGVLHLAALVGNYTLKTGSQIVRLTRTGSTWTTDRLVDTGRRVTGQIALADGPEERLHMLFYASGKKDYEGLFYTRPGSTRELNLEPGCDEGQVRVAIDAHDQPHVLLGCTARPSVYLAPTERYPTEYTNACTQSASALCGAACACGSSSCCYGDDPAIGNHTSCTSGPGDTARQLCESKALIKLCSDLTADPAPMLACQAALTEKAPACVGNQAVLPEVCLQVMNSNQ